MIRLRDIALALAAPLDEAFAADAANRVIARITSPEEAGPDDLCYVGSEQYAAKLSRSNAGVIIAPNKLALPPLNAVILRVADAELAIARVLELFALPPARPPVGVHPSAVIADDATLGVDVAIGPFVSVGRGASIGDGAVLHANVSIGDASRVGAHCEFHVGVAIRERVTIGSRVIVHANSVIGSDGFGYRWDGKRHVKVPQIGTVVIEDDVEIGSGSCIDRAKFGETRIGRGTKIDNLVQVGHNVRTGMHCILCGQVGIGGSTTLGHGVVMAAGAGARDHITLADGAIAAARSGINANIARGETVAGAPALPRREWLREQAALRRLPALTKELRTLQNQVAKLSAKLSEPLRAPPTPDGEVRP